MGDNLIHVKIEGYELVESKKDLLALQMSLIKNLQAVKEYTQLRQQELKIKTKLSRKIKEIKTEINKLNLALPKVKRPESIRKDVQESKEEKTSIKPAGMRTELDYELDEIQRKLEELQR